jgi:hypothetical protein
MCYLDHRTKADAFKYIGTSFLTFDLEGQVTIKLHLFAKLNNVTQRYPELFPIFGNLPTFLTSPLYLEGHVKIQLPIPNNPGIDTLNLSLEIIFISIRQRA